MRGYRFYDNSGETTDRYTAVKQGRKSWRYKEVLREMIGLSEAPYHPQGFCQSTEGKDGPHLGKRVDFSSLPEDVQKAIAERFTLPKKSGPSYQTNDPVGWCGDRSRGAALGRATIHSAPKEFDGKLTLRRVYLNNGGYDQNGTYFGHGAPLYWYASEDGEIDAMLRASSRESAKAEIRKDYPKARFYN